VSARRAILGALVTALLLAAGPANAHPLGNFSISHYAGIEIHADAIQVRYLIDMAEIPTFQATQDGGLVTRLGDPSVAPWVARTADTLGRGLRLEVAGRRLPLTAGATEIVFPPGAGDLPTLKVGVVYRAALPADARGPLELRYVDENFADRTGWKEIVVRAGAGVTLVSTSAPAAVSSPTTRSTSSTARRKTSRRACRSPARRRPPRPPRRRRRRSTCSRTASRPPPPRSPTS
jgi:hypothetical protein